MKYIGIMIVLMLTSACGLPQPFGYTANRLDPKIFYKQVVEKDYVMGVPTVVSNGDSVMILKTVKNYSKMNMAMNDSKKNLCSLDMKEIMKMSQGFDFLKNPDYTVYDGCVMTVYTYEKDGSGKEFLNAYYDLEYGDIDENFENLIRLKDPDSITEIEPSKEYRKVELDKTRVAFKRHESGIKFVVVNDGSNPSLTRDGEVDIMD